MEVAQILAIGRRWWWLLIAGVLFGVAAYVHEMSAAGRPDMPNLLLVNFAIVVPAGLFASSGVNVASGHLRSTGGVPAPAANERAL